MKKYLLTLCLSILSFSLYVASAQTADSLYPTPERLLTNSQFCVPSQLPTYGRAPHKDRKRRSQRRRAARAAERPAMRP